MGEQTDLRLRSRMVVEGCGDWEGSWRELGDNGGGCLGGARGGVTSRHSCRNHRAPPHRPPHHGAEASETPRQASVDHMGHRIPPHAANLTPSAYSKHFPPESHGDYYELSLRLWLIAASSINGPQLLHLPALRNHHIRGRPIQYTPHILDLPDHVHPLHDFPKRHILAVQKRRRLARDKELAAVRIRTGTTPIH